jgi:predicted membrane chloride channel (bestrophin family)
MFVLFQVNTLLNDPWVIDLIPFSLSTSALSLLLVFPMTSSYDRWWEARKVLLY